MEVRNDMSDFRGYCDKLGISSPLVLSLLLCGCAGDDGTVGGEIDLVDMRSGTLASGDIEAINGTYGPLCTDRSGSWSIAIDVGATLDNAPLSVILDDTNCVLTLTELQTTLGGDIEAVPAIQLSADFRPSPSAFADPVDFYANASMDSASFAGDFVITLLYSDDPAQVDGDNTAAFEVIESSSSLSTVEAPGHAINTDGLDLLVNSGQVVQSASGNVAVTLPMDAIAGQTYVVVDASGLDTYEELDAAYNGGIPVAIGDVPAAAFDLAGEDLDGSVIRTLIIANIQEGVAAYQAFEITFHPATGD
jgi:hypothetical protein